MKHKDSGQAINGLSLRLDRLHLRARRNLWLGYFAIFCRIALAAGFIPSGLVKIMGQRFTSLSDFHPMGQYLTALFHTGYYYTSIGILQVTAAILLLIPRTATLGAIIYFPIILNICILSLAVRFDGSLFSSPLMVLANLYLLCWDYHKLKFIFPFNHKASRSMLPGRAERSRKFPLPFFAGVATVIFGLVLLLSQGYELYPRNSRAECESQCAGRAHTQACLHFCECVHRDGQPLEQCLQLYEAAKLARDTSGEF